MKSLKKVLLGLLLIGVSINLDLNAGKRSKPDYRDLVGPTLRCLTVEEDSRYQKTAKELEEQDVTAARQQVLEVEATVVVDAEMPQADDLFFQPANELPGDLDDMIIPDPQAVAADRDYRDVLQAMVRAGQIRQFDEFINLIPHLPAQAQNGAIAGLVFVGGQVARSFLPVVTLAGEVQAQDFAVIGLGLTTVCAPVAYVTFQGGEWVVKRLINNPELLQAIRSKSQEAVAAVIKTANEIPAQARNVARKAKRAARNAGCPIQ